MSAPVAAINTTVNGDTSVVISTSEKMNGDEGMGGGWVTVKYNY